MKTWVLGVLVVLLLGGAPSYLLAGSDALPIEIAAPAGCTIHATSDQGGICDFRSDAGRLRRIIIDFESYHLPEPIPVEHQDPDTSQLAAKLHEEARVLFRMEIEATEAARDANFPFSNYRVNSRRFLPDAELPPGFDICLWKHDAYGGDREGTLVTRENLHCFGIDLADGISFQLLLSYLEHYPLDQDPSPSFASDADRVMQSIRRR